MNQSSDFQKLRNEVSDSPQNPGICLNCNSDVSLSRHQAADRASTLNNHFDNLGILKGISANLSNFATNDRTNVEKHIFCYDCQPLIIKHCFSKQSLLKLTSPHSTIGRLMQISNENAGCCTYNAENLFGRNEQTEKQTFLPKAETLIEYVLPHKDNNLTNTDSELTQREFENIAKMKPQFEFEEKFIRIQVKKLSESGNRTGEDFISKSCWIGDKSNSAGYIVCEKCGRQFSESRLLDNHRSVSHTGIELKYPCLFCFKTFSTQWFFKNHLQVSHNGLEILSFCQLCDKTFYSANEMQEHNVKHHDVRQYAFKCNYCTESFNEIPDLRRHLIEYHEDTQEAKYAATNMESLDRLKKSQVCKFCGVKFTKFSEIFDHMKEEHNYHLEAECNMCNEKFPSHQEMVKHQSMHLECQVCYKTFSSYGKLNIHFKYAHADAGSTLYCCEVCGKSQKNTMKLNAHYQHHKSKFGPKHFCNICNKSFDLTNHLITHIRNVHQDNPQKNKCPYCDKVFQSELSFNLHVEYFHDDKCLFSCQTCAKRCLTVRSLKKHNRVHKLSIPCKTEFEATGKIEVNSCFSLETLLYSCPICTKSCDSQPHFIRHLKLNHSVQGYTNPKFKNKQVANPSLKCPQCEKIFSRKDLLARHRRRMHLNQSAECIVHLFECSYCSKTWTKCTFSNFISHVKRHEILIVQLNGESKTNSEKELAEFYNEEIKCFNCSACKSKFVRQSVFLKHFKQKDHLKEFKVVFIDQKESKTNFPFQCPTCPDKSFPNKAMLTRHKEMHKTEQNKNNVCKICLLVLTSPRNLKQHMANVHPKKKKY